jgi:uncharacterized metal-binding protein (TIGR02443 family)
MQKDKKVGNTVLNETELDNAALNNAAPKKTKRFIAGAVCPECQKMDKTVTYIQDGEDVAECVSCGYMSQRPKEEDVRAINAEKDAQGVVQVNGVKTSAVKISAVKIIK